jgi:hypothetical protein
VRAGAPGIKKNKGDYNMKGFPKYLNTKEDYLYIQEHFSVEQVQPYFRMLLDTRLAWLPIKDTSKIGKENFVDKTHRIVEITSEEGIITELVYEELKEDPNCRAYQVGFTIVPGYIPLSYAPDTFRLK